MNDNGDFLVGLWNILLEIKSDQNLISIWQKHIKSIEKHLELPDTWVFSKDLEYKISFALIISNRPYKELKMFM